MHKRKHRDQQERCLPQIALKPPWDSLMHDLWDVPNDFSIWKVTKTRIIKMCIAKTIWWLLMLLHRWKDCMGNCTTQSYSTKSQHITIYHRLQSLLISCSILFWSLMKVGYHPQWDVTCISILPQNVNTEICTFIWITAHVSRSWVPLHRDQGSFFISLVLWHC